MVKRAVTNTTTCMGHMTSIRDYYIDTLFDPAVISRKLYKVIAAG